MTQSGWTTKWIARPASPMPKPWWMIEMMVRGETHIYMWSSLASPPPKVGLQRTGPDAVDEDDCPTFLLLLLDIKRCQLALDESTSWSTCEKTWDKETKLETSGLWSETAKIRIQLDTFCCSNNPTAYPAPKRPTARLQVEYPLKTLKDWWKGSTVNRKKWLLQEVNKITDAVSRFE